MITGLIVALPIGILSGFILIEDQPKWLACIVGASLAVSAGAICQVVGLP